MNENVTVCITPKGDKPVLHFSQFDNERVFTVTVLADDGESAAVLTGLDIEFRLRKTDSHVVTIAPESVADNVITFKTTEQMCACCGQNIATVTLMKDDMVVSTLDILVDIQRDILSGGLTSESDIRNLTTQIEQIVPEVVGDDYYNKQEVDNLLAEHTFDPSNYYDKSEVDDLIAEHTFDPSNYYDKSDVDDLLDDKADSADVYTKSETDNLLADKADSDDVYTKSEADILLSAKMNSISYNGIVDDVPMISFNTDCDTPLAIIKGKIDPNPSGVSTLTVTRTGRNILPKLFLLTTLNDVTLTPNPDGTLSFSGIASAICYFSRSFNLKKGSYIFSTGADESYSTYDTYISKDGTTIARGGNNLSPNSFTLTEDSSLLIVVRVRQGYNTAGLKLYPMIRVSSDSDTTYAEYNGQTATVNLGQSVTIGGVIDLTNGKVTLTDDTEISDTPVTVSSIAGANNIFLDTGNLTQIAYFEGVDDNLNKLIKAYQI